jgi:hypothetical protein
LTKRWSTLEAACILEGGSTRDGRFSWKPDQSGFLLEENPNEGIAAATAKAVP